MGQQAGFGSAPPDGSHHDKKEKKEKKEKAMLDDMMLQNMMAQDPQVQDQMFKELLAGNQPAGFIGEPPAGSHHKHDKKEKKEKKEKAMLDDMMAHDMMAQE